MKLPSIEIVNGKSSTVQRDYNFDRCVRVTFYHADSGQKGQVIYEYAPLKDEKYCARIEATVNDLPQINRINNRPGFTAVVTLYNISDTLNTLLASHTQFLLDFSEGQKTQWQAMLAQGGEAADRTLEKYYKNKIRLKIDCGYWDYENKQPNYGATPLFDGYVNSYVNYLKGNDIVSKFYCHDYKDDEISKKTIIESCGGKYNKSDLKVYLSNAIKDMKKKETKGRNWTDMFSQLVREYQPVRPIIEQNVIEGLLPKRSSSIPGVEDLTDEQISKLVDVTEADRKTNNWFSVLYIYTPSKKDERNVLLEEKLFNVSAEGFSTSQQFVNGMLNDLCVFRGVGVDWMIDYDYTPGKVTFFVFPTGKGNEYVGAKDADIQIVNYQNIIDNPTVSANGAMQIKMFLNKQCIPLRKIALILDESKGSETTTGDGLVIKAAPGLNEVMAAGQINPMNPSAIFGSRSAAVYTLQVGNKWKDGNGYMFNLGFPITTVKHEIATHSNEWFTTVTTIPCYTGVNLSK